MRLFLMPFLLLFSLSLNAQNLSGIVLDATTNLPIENVQVITKNATILTKENGRFSITNLAVGDKISFRIIGYETDELIVKKEMFNGNITIKLNSKSIDLREVNIRAPRNYKMDSLSLRKEYAAVFAYKAPNFTDMFVKVDPSYRSPFANINPNSTASILKFNALSAFSFFNKKKTSTSKMKEMLLRDETLNYVDNVFSIAKIAAITSLKGDSLQTFRQRYRPNLETLKKMNDYEIMLYIKKSYIDFLKPK